MLIQNSDRHLGHFLFAEHWAKGSYKGGKVTNDAWKGRRQPVLIDQVGKGGKEAQLDLGQRDWGSWRQRPMVSALMPAPALMMRTG